LSFRRCRRGTRGAGGSRAAAYRIFENDHAFWAIALSTQNQGPG
jgi:hypothetical protein